MTTERETLRIIGSWMEEGRTRLPDHVLDAVLDQLPATPQRRPTWSTRRIPAMNPLAKFAIAAAAVVVVALVGYNLFGPSGTSQVGGVPPASSAEPSSGPSEAPTTEPSQAEVPLAPTSGTIEAGRYRWTSPGGDVTFDVPDGWSGAPYTITRNDDTPAQFDLVAYLPGTQGEVTHVYADACASEGTLTPVDGTDPVGSLTAALEGQASTEAGTSWFNGPGGVSDPPVGMMVEIRPTPGVDRATCRFGADGPLQIWADPAETTFFALAPGFRGIVYVFDEGGERFVFGATLGPEATDADADEISGIVQSMEFTSLAP